MSTPPPDRDAELLRQFLAGRDVPCSGCGYNLRDLPSAACPECGVQISLCIEKRYSPTALWIVGIIASSGGAVFCIAIAGYWLWGLSYLGVNTPLREWWPVIVGAPIHTTLTGMLIRFEKRLRSGTVSRRAIVAIACVALTLATIMVFFWNVLP